MSLRNSLTRHNYSPSGFQQLPEAQAGGDASINIPMEPVNRSASSKTSGSRRAGERSPALPSAHHYNEKRGSMPPHIKRHGTDPKADDGALTTMGRIYDKIKNFSIVTRYLLYVIPVGIILVVPIVFLSLRNSLTMYTKVSNPPFETGSDKYCNKTLVTDSSTFIFPIGVEGDNTNTICRDFKRWGGVRPLWIFVWLEVFWCALWVAKLFAKATPSIFQFLCGIVSPGVRKYKSVLAKLEVPISLAVWFVIGLTTWTGFIGIDAPDYTRAEDGTDGKPHGPSPYSLSVSEIPWALTFQHVILSFLLASVILLGEQALIQLISISYHHTTYDTKIKASKHNVDTITLLYDASISLFPAYCPEFAEEDYIINDSLELPKAAGMMGTGGRPKSGSATPMRLLQNVGRFGDKVTAVFGNIASEVTGKQVFNPMASHSIIVEALEKKRSCEALARRIWMSLVVEGRDALFLDDVQEVLSGQHNVNTEEVFGALDKDGNGDVSLDEMIMTVVEIGRERHDIATSLHDVDQAIKVLDRMLLFVVLLLVIFVFVLVLSPSAVTSFSTVGTSLLSLSFVFAVTCQEILGSCIFLFVKHPFDVGDRVDVGEKPLVVERISLLYTIFKCVNTGKNTQTPNIVLNTLWVDNVSRSGAMKEQLMVNIDFTTSLEDIELLRTELQNFVLDKENSRDFQPEVLVEVTGLAEMNKMELKVEIRHKSNWHNETLRAARRSKFMCALVLALRKVPINPPGGADAALGSANQPSWSVAISPEDAKGARKAFQDAAAAKKLANQKPSNSDGGSSTGANPNFLSPENSLRNRSGGNTTGLAPSSEANALNNLNSRQPTGDVFGYSENEQAGLSPGRPAVENSKSPVRADSQRMHDLNGVYDTLQKSPSAAQRGKRRESYQLNVTQASPTGAYLPQIQERDILAPSADSSPSVSEFDGAATRGSKRRSGSPSGKAYSPLGRDTFEDNIFNHSGWAAGNFAEQPTAASPYKTYNAPPPPPAGRYASPPPQLAAAQQHAAAVATQLQQQQSTSLSGTHAVANPQSPGESWFQRDSDIMDNVVMHQQAHNGGHDSNESPIGPPSARASSVALGSFAGGVDSPTMPTEPMPMLPQTQYKPQTQNKPQTQTRPGTGTQAVQQATSKLQEQISRGQSTKSDASYRKGDDGAHF